MSQNNAEASSTNGQLSNGNSSSNGIVVTIRNSEDYNNEPSTSRGKLLMANLRATEIKCDLFHLRFYRITAKKTKTCQELPCGFKKYILY